jgi:hypothetical protein
MPNGSLHSTNWPPMTRRSGSDSWRHSRPFSTQLVIYFTQVAPTVVVMVSLAFGASNHGLVRCRFDHDRLLHQAVEQLASISGSPSIEAEGEFIERKLQVLMAHRPLVRAQYPPLQHAQR